MRACTRGVVSERKDATLSKGHAAGRVGKKVPALFEKGRSSAHA